MSIRDELLGGSYSNELAVDSDGEEIVADGASGSKDGSWHEIDRHALVNFVGCQGIAFESDGGSDGGSWGVEFAVSVGEGESRWASCAEIVAWT